MSVAFKHIKILSIIGEETKAKSNHNKTRFLILQSNRNKRVIMHGVDDVLEKEAPAFLGGILSKHNTHMPSDPAGPFTDSYSEEVRMENTCEHVAACIKKACRVYKHAQKSG